jgi:hypothetical protein
MRPYTSLATEKAFSAIEAQHRRSSIVAMKVGNEISHLIEVKTFAPLCVVLIDKPDGTFTLSGDTALATASASRLFL